MDSNYDLSNEQNITAKKRFESFKLGVALPSTPPALQGQPKLSHGRSHSRSHSRNSSISSISTLSLSNSISTSSVNSMGDRSASPPKQRPSSHHRRRSSVSTRRESAELMGVSVPTLPASKSDDNINLGEKDSIRRRALWALEGKPDVSYSKVEIPELVSPSQENSGFNFPSKPSYPAGTGAGFGGGLDTLALKRDSVGKYMGSASSKDQLHTLVEEEEEEEENIKRKDVLAVEVLSESAAESTQVSSPPAVSVAKHPPSRPRPATLNLRPLALTSGSVISPANGLPTPTLTPATKASGLKSLSLITSPGTPSANNNDNAMVGNVRRQSLTSQTPTGAPSRRRPSLNINCDGSSPLSLDGMKRQSSISYKSSVDITVRNATGLPTPLTTPIVSDRREMSWSGDDELIPNHRPLSVSEQHFLFKSHNALLARITDLENALTCRARSRPASGVSDVSSGAASEPTDEMLSLITDLKAERDELKRDVDGWRTRVADLEDKVGKFSTRVEAERREAWVARSRLGLLEVEKTGLEKSLKDKDVLFQEVSKQLDSITEERNYLKANLKEVQEAAKRKQGTEEECTQLQAALQEERQIREDLERMLEHAGLLATPTPETSSFKRQMFRSMDSEASLTDVEPFDDIFPKGVTLKAVVEEEDTPVGHDEEFDWEEDNGLAGYEDEEDSDVSFESPNGSSVGSMDDYSRADLHMDTPSLVASDVSSHSASPTPTATPAPSKHVANNSLSKTWTFPSRYQLVSPPRYEREVDRFFGCLEDLDSSPPIGFMAKEPSYKGLFSKNLNADTDSDDEMPPFVFPSHVGMVVDTSMKTLGVVHEEEEAGEEGEEEQVVEVKHIDEDFDGEEFEGGIRFTFNTPTTPIVSVTPPFETEANLRQSSITEYPPIMAPFDEEEDAQVPFAFSKPRSKHSVSSTSSMDSFESDMSISARNFSPSSIPRSKALKSFSSTSLASSSPPKAGSMRFVQPSGYSANALMTPPSKRGGMIPSMIPQPVVSPLKTLPPAPPKLVRQPQRRPGHAITLPSGKANGSSFKPQPESTRRPNLSSPRVFHSQRRDERSL